MNDILKAIDARLRMGDAPDHVWVTVGGIAHLLADGEGTVHQNESYTKVDTACGNSRFLVPLKGNGRYKKLCLKCFVPTTLATLGDVWPGTQ